MAVPKTVVARDINDFKLARITEDSASVYSTGTLYDVPGISAFSMGFEFDTDELRGDAKVKDIYSKIDKVTGSFGGCIELDVFQACLGGYSYEANVHTNRWRMVQEVSPYVYFETQTILHGSVGDLHSRVWKARVTNIQIEQSSQSYVTFTADYEAIPTVYEWSVAGPPAMSGNLFFDLEIADQVVAISTVATP